MEYSRGQIVDADYVLPFRDQAIDEMRADEASGSGNQYAHLLLLFFFGRASLLGRVDRLSIRNSSTGQDRAGTHPRTLTDDRGLHPRACADYGAGQQHRTLDRAAVFNPCSLADANGPYRGGRRNARSVRGQDGTISGRLNRACPKAPEQCVEVRSEVLLGRTDVDPVRIGC